MPDYEYYCPKCKKDVTVHMSFSEYDRHKPKCPHCKGTQLEKRVTTVSVKTSKKS